MEEFKAFIITNWSTIAEYAMMAVSYFLVFLYRSKIKDTKQNLTIMFKEKAQEVSTTDRKLREDAVLLRKIMTEELEEAKKLYNAAVDEIKTLKYKLAHAECALLEMIKEREDVEEVITDGTEN